MTVLAHVIAQDVGKALNPALVEGQMHGGTAQGLGWALPEELAHDENGQLRGGPSPSTRCLRPTRSRRSRP